MRDGVQLAEVAALVGDPARAHILAALLDGRALTAGEPRLCRKRVAPDRERASREARRGSPRRGRPPGPASVLPPRRRRRRADARKHHGGCRRRPAALPPRFEGGCGDADGADLLRPFGRPARRRPRRCADGPRSRRSRRGRRRGDRGGGGLPRGASASCSPGRSGPGVRSVAPASTGPSAVRISPGESARRSRRAASISAGSSGGATAARSRSRARASRASSSGSACVSERRRRRYGTAFPKT